MARFITTIQRRGSGCGDGAWTRLPLQAVRQALYTSERQRLIPFLGAGASLPSLPVQELAPPAKRPAAETLDRVCAELEIANPVARRFVDISLQFAELLAQHPTPDTERAEIAPSSWELARRLADALRLEPFRPVGDRLKSILKESPGRDDYAEVIRGVADVMGLSRTIPQLLTVASYFRDGTRRATLRSELLARFNNVTQVTPIQQRIAEAAAYYVEAQNRSPVKRKQDYIIITTNYDSLMERCLDSVGVPTCVVTVDRRSRVLTEFMDHAQASLKLPDAQFEAIEALYETRPAAAFEFQEKTHSLAMVYKIHGCPVIDDHKRIDNIVISDQDYVAFIKQNGKNNELIPAYVANRMLKSGFLFLGYSLSDWNVRSVYQEFFKNRQMAPPEHNADFGDEDEETDYIVMRSYEDPDDYFLQNYNVSVLVTELDAFATALALPGVAA